MLDSNIYIGIHSHTLKTRPFKDRVLNVIFIFIELAISVCFTTAGILLNPDVDQEALMWTILGCMYLSYLLHSILGYYKLIKVIYPKIKPYLCKYKLQDATNKTTVKTGHSGL
jgi:hypothetical protein